MSLTRREILEELGRLGIKGIQQLKQACREYEYYWKRVLEQRQSPSDSFSSQV